ncbi:TPA: hypothetical protein MM852_004754 [Salmonella enterica subsp. enterica]|uniref:hypothetical protein n=1 Tax=Salmonella enterica TaxID=28901 RepID=UPI000A50DF18|nr:hypothetical protein [Salmonella enterica subsp. enterica serovar Napoli]HBJ6783610.1 hypothetical protein [Salmonella enterica subsp. enterica serovar Salford]HBZ8587371.1 hypothetical protein [Salmonella enterica subsp. enterica]HBB6983085.1 hypothetical protein [Salmonella enterica subsp. enterica serovar Napoli]HBC0336527.1 hypothetical protein [Salmonella enterica subsp. enterica serovar Napoli]
MTTLMPDVPATTGNLKYTAHGFDTELFYFYCAKNETNPYPVPDGSFKKLMERYEELKDAS